MPKDQLVLNQFEGGLMEHHDPRDIPENALSVADDVMVDKVGLIRTMGRQHPHPFIGNPTNASSLENNIPVNFTPGYGFFGFGSDYGITADSSTGFDSGVYAVIANESGGTTSIDNQVAHGLSAGDRIQIEGSSFNGEYVVQGITSATQFTITNSTSQGTNERFYWYLVSNNSFNHYLYAAQNQEKIAIIDEYVIENRITLGTNTANVEPSFYYNNDALRVSDGNYTNTDNSTRWYGYIPERTQFKDHAVTTNTFNNTNYNTHSDVSSTGFTAIELGAQESLSCSDADIPLRDGVTMKVTFAATLTSGATPLVYLSTAAGDTSVAKSEVRQVKAGTNTYYLTPRALHATNKDDTSVICFYTNGVTSYAIASLTMAYVSYIPSKWYEEPHEIAAPTDTTFEAHSADVDLNGDIDEIIQKYMVGFTEDTGVANGEFMGADNTLFKVGMSYIYLGGQESKIYEDTEEIALTANNSGLNAQIASPIYADSIDESAYIDHRIIGARIYITSEGSDTNSFKSKDSPLLLIDIDNVKGARWWNGDWKAWGEINASTDHVAAVSLTDLEEYPIISYRALNGYEHDNNTLKAEWKTACIANNRTYIGNIYQASIDDQDSTYTNNPTIYSKQYGDRIIKSPFKKYDVFPAENFLEVIPGDGDEIIKLLEFSNRLFVFKQKTLYVVNIAEDTEVIESTHRDSGIKYSHSVTETPYGPVWVNDSGCFTFDGEKLTNLIENKIKPKNWKNFMLNGSGMVGYIPYRKQIVVMSGPEGASESSISSINNVYIYDFITQSWTRGLDKIMPSTSRSNIITSNDNQMIWIYNRPIDETVIITDTTNVAGAFSQGAFGWDGGTLADNCYLFFYNGSSWTRFSEEISTTALAGIEQQVNAMQQAINATGTFTAYGFVGMLGVTGSIYLQANTATTGTNGSLVAISGGDGNLYSYTISSSKNFSGSPPADTPAGGLTGYNFGSDSSILAGGVTSVSQVTTLEYNRQGSTADGVVWFIRVVWYGAPNQDGDSIPGNFSSTSYITAGNPNNDGLATGIKNALDASTFGVPFLDYATAAVTDNILTITALNPNQQFMVQSYVVGSQEGNAVAYFPNGTNNEIGGLKFDVQTRDIDFGTPGVRKKVYKVYLTYKADLVCLYPQYAVDGHATTWYDFDDTSLSATTNWSTVALKPATSSQANNIYSFKFRLKVSDSASMIRDIQINDITVVYRTKSIK